MHNNKDSINRLKRAHGHLSKVIQMLEKDKPCGDVLQQLSAVISALGSSRVQIIKSHLDTCLTPALKPKHQSLVKEIEEVISRAMKI